MPSSPRLASPYLTALAKRHPTPQKVLAELAHLGATLTLPTWAVHIVSDVHGEHVKFRHVINNASGSLRPRLARLFAGRLDEAQLGELLNLLYYPRETWQAVLGQDASAPARSALLARIMPLAADAIRELARGYTLSHLARVLPDPFDNAFLEQVFAPSLDRAPQFLAALSAPFVASGRDLELWRLAARAIRNLAIGELIVAGDLGDRGPRVDKVIEVMQQQPACAITWGNHDASWMGACLGQPALVATVVRLSLRHGRTAQLEEGYGISLTPLEQLADQVYAGDPCARFVCKGEASRDPAQLARMHKAAAILQFKLEGQLIARHPDWDLGHRNLLARLQLRDGTVATVEIDGQRYPLLDTAWPTLDPANPCALSAEEASCLATLVRAFVESPILWDHMQFVSRAGCMWLRRDLALVFHGAVPVDERGDFLAFTIDGEPRAGRALFDAFERVVQRAFRQSEQQAGSAAPADLDHFWYLWSGPSSPCFGKDRMATFEGHFVAAPATHKETKNPYFSRINDAAFCERVLAEFGADVAHGLIVNGHVPVKLAEGESALKRSGRAVTIDGAFAAAYGDRGYSLVLDAERVWLAKHHHFGSVADAVVRGDDIVPTVTELMVHPRPRTVADTEAGEALRGEIEVLHELLAAYADNRIAARGQGRRLRNM
jgi:fructose-1,6-bisphosphatase-3